MSQSTLSQSFIDNQIKECLQACSDLSKEAKEMKLPHIPQNMHDLSVHLIELKQDFKIYSHVFCNAKVDEDYDNLVNKVNQEKVLRANSLAIEKQEELEKLFGTIEAEDDVTYTGGEIGLICPLLADIPKNPVISKKCHHVFEKSLIQDYILQRVDRGSIECPNVGCNAKISMKDIIEDETITKKCEEARKARESNDWEKV